MLNFPIEKSGPFSDLFRANDIADFAAACSFIGNLPYERISQRNDLTLVLKELRGTCSSKHAVLAYLALEQEHPEVELIAGIFLMSGETHPILATFFDEQPYDHLPECHCYLRIGGERFDFTTKSNLMERIAPKIVREQRIDPHQVVEWKEQIHRHYLEGWLKRNPQLDLSFDELWSGREQCILILSEKRLPR